MAALLIRGNLVLCILGAEAIFLCEPNGSLSSLVGNGNTSLQGRDDLVPFFCLAALPAVVDEIDESSFPAISFEATDSVALV